MNTTFATGIENREEITSKWQTVNRHALVIFPQVKATRNCGKFAKRGIQARSPPQRERFAGFHQGDFLCEDRRIRKRKKTDAKGENESRLRESSPLSS